MRPNSKKNSFRGTYSRKYGIILLSIYLTQFNSYLYSFLLLQQQVFGPRDTVSLKKQKCEVYNGSTIKLKLSCCCSVYISHFGSV